MLSQKDPSKDKNPLDEINKIYFESASKCYHLEADTI